MSDRICCWPAPWSAAIPTIKSNVFPADPMVWSKINLMMVFLTSSDSSLTGLSFSVAGAGLLDGNISSSHSWNRKLGGVLINANSTKRTMMAVSSDRGFYNSSADIRSSNLDLMFHQLQNEIRTYLFLIGCDELCDYVANNAQYRSFYGSSHNGWRHCWERKQDENQSKLQLIASLPRKHGKQCLEKARCWVRGGVPTCVLRNNVSPIRQKPSVEQPSYNRKEMSEQGQFSSVRGFFS